MGSLKVKLHAAKKLKDAGQGDCKSISMGNCQTVLMWHPFKPLVGLLKCLSPCQSLVAKGIIT